MSDERRCVWLVVQSGPGLAAAGALLSEPGARRQSAPHVVDDADDEGCESSDMSYAKKPLPPVKTTRTGGRMFIWHRSQSVENIPRATAVSEKPEPVSSPQPKTPTNSKGMMEWYKGAL